MAGHETTVMGVVVEGLPHIVPHPERVELMDDGEGFGLLQGFPGGRGRWRSVCIGAARGSAMCEFSLSGRPVRVIRPPGPPTLKLGFVQNIISAKRIAMYSVPSAAPVMLPAVFNIFRDPLAIGTGLLDCGTADPPWFQGKSAS